MAEDTSLATKYRPDGFDEVVGQDAVVKSMKMVLEKKSSKCFLLSGPSGTGKTTLARIAARTLGVKGSGSLREIDAASKTGVDDMRQVCVDLAYKALGGGGRALIVDECHQLSKAAWNSLLKITEEPPPETYWFFCTTEPGKVPVTIKRRSSTYDLKLVPDKTLGALLKWVCKEEALTIKPEIMDLVIKESKGSPRQALVNLAMVSGLDDRKEAASILQTVVESEPVIELARFLLKGGSWTRAMALYEGLENDNPESVRIVIANYFAAVVKGSKTDRDAARHLSLLSAFSEPYVSSDRSAPLLMSIGRALFSD